MNSLRPRLAACIVVLGALSLSSLAWRTTAGQQPGVNNTLASRKNAAGRPNGNVDLTHSRVYIFVGKTGLGHEHGVEGRLQSGAINLGATRQAGSLVFDMKAFDADTPVARRYVGLEGTTDAGTRAQVNANMKGPAVLDVARFPTARFDIQSARSLQQSSKQGNRLYELSGQFTLHGVKRPLRFRCEEVSQEGTKRLRGNFVIRQSQFAIKPFTKALGVVGVTDALRIYGDIVFELRRDTANSGAKHLGVQR